MLHRSYLVTALVVAAAAPALAENGLTQATGVVVVDGAPVRGAPRADAKLFPQRLRQGQQLRLIGRQGRYLKIAGRAFVHGNYVTEGRIDNCAFLNVRATRNGQVVKVLPAGTRLQLTGRSNGDWLEIETVAFVDSQHVQPLEEAQAAQTMETPTDKLTPNGEATVELPVDEEIVEQDAEEEAFEFDAEELEQELAQAEDEGLPLPSLGETLAKTVEPFIEEELETWGEQQTEPTKQADGEWSQDFEEWGDDDWDDSVDLNLNLEEAEELLKELETDMDSAWEEAAASGAFDDQAQFEDTVQKCRRICDELRAERVRQADPHGIAAVYELERGVIGKNPHVVLEVSPTDLRDHYRVTRTRTHKGETVVNQGGVGKWNAKKQKLSIEWDRANGAAQVLMNGQDQGDDGAGATAADYRIQASTGEIRGDFASPEEGWAREKGWRQGSIQPLEGVYQLQPSWYAFGNKPVTTLTVSAPDADGACTVTREVPEREISLQGVATVKDRTLKVTFPDHPTITYTIEENGKVKGVWYTDNDDVFDDDDDGERRAEKGWREEVPQDEIPSALQRGFRKLKGVFGK
jgi:hypothetical protein